jgi:hypothetical protein
MNARVDHLSLRQPDLRIAFMPGINVSHCAIFPVIGNNEYG